MFEPLIRFRITIARPALMKRRMAATATMGKLLYKVYRAFSYGLSPLLYLHLRWRVLRGLEHPLRWPERLGSPSHPRPPGPLLWFHAVSLGSHSFSITVPFRIIHLHFQLLTEKLRIKPKFVPEIGGVFIGSRIEYRLIVYFVVCS